MRILTEKEYRESRATNYSLLKAQASHPIVAKTFIDNSGINSISTPSLEWGTLIDCLMTTPEEFDNMFFISKTDKIPQDKMLLMCNEVWRSANGVIENITDDMILTARTVVEYDARLKGETVLAKFKDECGEYIEDLKEAGAKSIITKQYYTEAVDYIAEIKANRFLVKFLNGVQDADSASQTQLAIEDDISIPSIHGTLVKCKIKIDQCIISNDHTKATIIDYKTCDNVDMFIANYFKYKYYIQGGFYHYVLKQAMPTLKFVEMYFVAMGRDKRVLIYKMSDHELELAKFGSIDVYGRPIKGIFQLISELEFHKNTSLWSYTKQQYDDDGIVILDDLRNDK